MTRDARKHEHNPRDSLDRGSFARLTPIVKMVTGAVSGWTTCDTSTVFCTTFLVFTLCKRSTIGRHLRWMCLGLPCTVVIMGEQPFCAHEKSTSFVAHALTMRDAPPSWWDRRCCSLFFCRTVVAMRRTTSRPLGVLRNIMTEVRKTGTDFCIGGDINIEITLETLAKTSGGSTVLNGIVFMDPNAEVAVRMSSLTKNLRWLQLLKEFNCTVTSTWVDNDDRGDYHTWRAWGSRGREKQLDYIMGPRDLQSTTWFLNKVRLRTWDHFPVVLKIDGTDVKAGRAGFLDLKTKKSSFKNSLSARVTVVTGCTKLGTMGWSPYKNDWKKRRRSRLQRRLRGTRTSLWSRTRSGRWRQRQQNAGTR